MSEPAREDYRTDQIKTAIFEALGAASMCWEPVPEGIFDADSALLIGDELVERLAEIG